MPLPRVFSQSSISPTAVPKPKKGQAAEIETGELAQPDPTHDDDHHDLRSGDPAKSFGQAVLAKLLRRQGLQNLPRPATLETQGDPATTH